MMIKADSTSEIWAKHPTGVLVTLINFMETLKKIKLACYEDIFPVYRELNNRWNNSRFY